MVRVRFAPSPTGYLHLGNIRTALFNYLYAKKHDGKFVLRIEDTDRERFQQSYRDAFLEDLLWMGIRWDEGPEMGGEFGPYEQSQRMEIYQGYIQKLLDEGKAYYCYVTQEEVEESKRIAKLNRQPPRFDNRGRHFSEEEIEKRKAQGIKPTIRFKIENPQLEMDDLVRGKVSFNLDDMVGDFVIQRADGNPTFHLVVCIDDALMKITHVIRGEDHLSNTPKHILLYKAMGFEPPQFGHLSLVHGPGGEPLSKRLESVSVREFRKKGYLPYGLANYIALLGWSSGDDQELFSWDELQKVFDITRVGKSASIFDPQKLDWVNGQHLRKMPVDDFVKAAMAYLKNQGHLDKIEVGENEIAAILPAFQDAISRFDQLMEKLSFLTDDFSYENSSLLEAEEAKEIFEKSLSVIPELNWDSESLYQDYIAKIKPLVSAKGKSLFMPIRMALTGQENGPELKKLMPLMSREKVSGRLEKAMAR